MAWNSTGNLLWRKLSVLSGSWVEWIQLDPCFKTISEFMLKLGICNLEKQKIYFTMAAIHEVLLRTSQHFLMEAVQLS